MKARREGWKHQRESGARLSFSNGKERIMAADCFKTAFRRSRRGSDSCPSAGRRLLRALRLHLLLLEVSLSRRPVPDCFQVGGWKTAFLPLCISCCRLSRPFHETTWQSLAVSTFSNSVCTHLFNCPAVVPNNELVQDFQDTQK